MDRIFFPFRSTQQKRFFLLDRSIGEGGMGREVDADFQEEGRCRFPGRGRGYVPICPVVVGHFRLKYLLN